MLRGGAHDPFHNNSMIIKRFPVPLEKTVPTAIGSHGGTGVLPNQRGGSAIRRKLPEGFRMPLPERWQTELRKYRLGSEKGAAELGVNRTFFVIRG